MSREETLRWQILDGWLFRELC